MKKRLSLSIVKVLVLGLLLVLVSSCKANIPRAMAPVANGQGHPGAGEFNPHRLGPPRLVVLDASGSPHLWNEQLAEEWRPSSVSEVELVVQVGPEREIGLGSQPYIGGPPITRYKFAVDVELREARTGQAIGRTTLLGEEPEPFPGKASVGITRLEGEHVAAADLETWLECQIQERCIMLTNNARFEGRFVFIEGGETLAIEMKDCVLAGCRWDLWRISDGMFIGETRNSSGLAACDAVYSPDGMSWAKIDYSDIRLHRVRNGQVEVRRTERILKGHIDYVNCVTFSPDGTLLATASHDRTVRLWRVADGSLLRTLRAHRDYVERVAFSPDGESLVSSAHDGSVWLWKLSQMIGSQ